MYRKYLFIIISLKKYSSKKEYCGGGGYSRYRIYLSAYALPNIKDFCVIVQFPEESCVDETTFPPYSTSSSSSSSTCSEIEAAFLPSSPSLSRPLAHSRPLPSSLTLSLASDAKVKLVKGPSLSFVKGPSLGSLSSESNVSEAEQYFYI